jgi:hypothetical protein
LAIEFGGLKKRAMPVLFLPILTGCGDIVERYYPSYESANVSGAMKRGWIPGWLPKSARNINEAHSIDTNESLLSFEFQAADWKSIQHRCVGIAHSAVREPGIQAEWWPRVLPESALPADQLGYYSCENGSAFMAANYLEGHAYYWRP